MTALDDQLVTGRLLGIKTIGGPSVCKACDDTGDGGTGDGGPSPHT